MPVKRVQDYLSQNHVKYSAISHPLAYTSKEIAHLTQVPEHQFAKTLIMIAGEKKMMVVLPASDTIDWKKLKKALQLRGKDVRLASEPEFSTLFPDCELGAMPPFGNLYHLEVYIDKVLRHNKDIVFNAGTHTELVKMSYQDFVSLVHPQEIALH